MAMTWYSQAFSLKYLRDVNARPPHCTSSRTIKVAPRQMVCFAARDSLGIRYSGVMLLSKIFAISGWSSKLRQAMLS